MHVITDERRTEPGHINILHIFMNDEEGVFKDYVGFNLYEMIDNYIHIKWHMDVFMGGTDSPKPIRINPYHNDKEAWSDSFVVAEVIETTLSREVILSYQKQTTEYWKYENIWL